MKPNENNDVLITVTYRDKNYLFENGSEAFIFHAGILNNFVNRYGVKQLLRYTCFVKDCYTKDDGSTPLGALADYIAKHWKQVQKMDRSAILRAFYDSVALEVA